MQVMMLHTACSLPPWLICDVRQRMILRTQVTFSAAGERFTPSRVSAPFNRAHNPGEIGMMGRFRGKPEPSGYASIDAPEEEKAKIAWLHRIVKRLLPALKEA